MWALFGDGGGNPTNFYTFTNQYVYTITNQHVYTITNQYVYTIAIQDAYTLTSMGNIFIYMCKYKHFCILLYVLLSLTCCRCTRQEAGGCRASGVFFHRALSRRVFSLPALSAYSLLVTRFSKSHPPPPISPKRRRTA